ncbi:MAG: P44/Msp2 family outer membrane protein, partial [Cyanobacteriota bacterium]|nr:P44/Msp2 family outer membrane protein [Cyanobacteriota bacterium]
LASALPVKAESIPSSLKEFLAESSSQGAEDLIMGNETSLNLPDLLAQDAPPVENVQTVNKPNPNQRDNYGYVSLGLGVGFPNNATADDVLVRVDGIQLGNGNAEQSLDAGFAGEIAGGYQFRDFRVELGIGYGGLNGGGGTVSGTDPLGQPVSVPYSADVSGDYVSVLVNAYYDIPTGTKLRPYIGAGIGYVNVSFGDVSFATDAGQVEVVTGNSGGAFGYQGKLGLSYEAIPKGNIFGEVVYLGSTNPSGTSGSYSALGVWRLALGWRQGF